MSEIFRECRRILRDDGVLTVYVYPQEAGGMGVALCIPNPRSRRFKSPKDVLEKQRLEMLGWLVKQRLLEVRVGVMRHGTGIMHAKFGIMTDAAGQAVVFSGSGNESASGLVANYERLEVSRLEGTTALVWPDGETQKISGIAEALQQDVLIVSRETARTQVNLAIFWLPTRGALVLLDEAHAARRRQQVEGEFNGGNLLLNLLRQLQLRRRARGIMLLSATPMQIQPWEPCGPAFRAGGGRGMIADFAAVRISMPSWRT